LRFLTPSPMVARVPNQEIEAIFFALRAATPELSGRAALVAAQRDPIAFQEAARAQGNALGMEVTPDMVRENVYA
jgi:hypothetical protein